MTNETPTGRGWEFIYLRGKLFRSVTRRKLKMHIRLHRLELGVVQKI